MKRNNLLYKMIAVVFILIAGVSGIFAQGDFSKNRLKNSFMEESFQEDVSEESLSFRNEKLLNEHYEKHGIEMGFSSAQAYEEAANKVVTDDDALHKLEAYDGDDVYYLEDTNEFVIVSTDGYIRTYFYPNDGIDYFNRQ